MRKLLIIARSIDGGTGTFIASILKVQRELKYNVQTIVLEKPKYRRISNNIIFYKKSIIPEHYSLNPLYFYSFLKELLWLSKQINRTKPDLIVCVDIYCAVIIQMYQVLSFRQTDVILTIHNNLSEVLQQKTSQALFFFLKKIVQFTLNNVHMIVCTSKRLAADIKKAFSIREEIRVIYYGIKQTKKNNKLTKINKNIVLSMGRFTKQKDFCTLIRAFFLVQKKLKDAELWLVGKGPQASELKNLVKKLNIVNKVKFVGWVQNPTLIMDKVAVFVLSSLWEGFGYVLLEAMSRGVPVISTNTAYGPLEILDGGKYGLLVDVGDEEKMATKISYLLASSVLLKKWGKKAKKRSEFFSEKTMQNSYKILINSFNK